MSREEIQLKPMAGADAVTRATPEPAIGGGNDISEGKLFFNSISYSISRNHGHGPTVDHKAGRASEEYA
jgi:hypothetical protein